MIGWRARTGSPLQLGEGLFGLPIRPAANVAAGLTPFEALLVGLDCPIRLPQPLLTFTDHERAGTSSAIVFGPVQADGPLVGVQGLLESPSLAARFGLIPEQAALPFGCDINYISPVGDISVKQSCLQVANRLPCIVTRPVIMVPDLIRNCTE